MKIKDKPVVNYNYLAIEFEDPLDWPEGDLDEIIGNFEDLKERYSDAFQVKAYVQCCWDDYSYKISGFRSETEKQYKARIKREEEALAKWESKYLAWMQKQGEAETAKKQKELDEQISLFKALKQKLEAEGKLPLDN